MTTLQLFFVSLSIEEYCHWGFWRMDYFLGRQRGPVEAHYAFYWGDLKRTVECCHKEGSGCRLIPNGAAKTTTVF